MNVYIEECLIRNQADLNILIAMCEEILARDEEVSE